LRQEEVIVLKSLLCRLNLRHEWHQEFTEDRKRYKRCARCGKDHPYVGKRDGGPGAGSGMEWHRAHNQGG
jgi:hypothetical protein